jgi:hypothetical protein
MATWECISGCRDELGEKPFRFIDQALAAENDAAARVTWRAAFGEEIPEPQRPGRKPRERRSRGVRVMLTTTELLALDQQRGQLSRSEFLRLHGLGSAQGSA